MKMKLPDDLAKYCPTMVSFLSMTTDKWDKIKGRLKSRTQSISAEVNRFGEVKAGTTIYDLVQMAQYGDVKAASFLKLIDSLFEDVNDMISSEHYPRLRQTAINLVSDFDPHRSGYLNPIGELFSVLTLLKNSDYTLKQVEFPLPNGNTADYCLIHPNGVEVLVEVVNIHFKKGMIRSDSDLYSFLSYRVAEKIAAKTDGIELSRLGRKFLLLPVVWCDFEDIHSYLSVFEKIETEHNTLSFCVVGQIPSEDGTTSLMFSTVSRLVQIYNNQGT